MHETSASGRHPIIRAGLATEQAVYGVLLVAGMIVIGGSHATTSWQVLVTVVATVLVFWAAHVYAGTIARHGFEDDGALSLAESFRLAAHASWGLLVSALIPCAILLLGTLRIVPDAPATWLALWSCIVLLGVLGYLAHQRRGAPMHLRILGALVTASFGGLLALLKVLVH